MELPEIIYHRLVKTLSRRYPNDFEDVAHSVFLRLLEKNRFEHYAESGMTMKEIEAQINQLETKNFLNEMLRRKRPEAYRMARRIAELVRSGSEFAEFEQSDHETRSTARIIGLSIWETAAKPRQPMNVISQRIFRVGTPIRNRTIVGRGGESDLIISNSDLKDLIIEILTAADSPIQFGELRRMVIDRLPLFDMVEMPMATGGEDEEIDYPDATRETPLDAVLRRERMRGARQIVNEFLAGLRRDVRGKPKRYEKILSILRSYYLSPHSPNQIELSRYLGISDSSTSDYRKQIESRLRRLPFSTISDAEHFKEILTAEICV